MRIKNYFKLVILFFLLYRVSKSSFHNIFNTSKYNAILTLTTVDSIKIGIYVHMYVIKLDKYSSIFQYPIFTFITINKNIK